MHQDLSASPPEKFITIQEAADALGVLPWKLDRAVRRGLVPCYRILNSRRLVRLSEVVSSIERSRTGGANA